MYITGGDGRSVVAPNARDSMPPNHPSAGLWDRQGFCRDKFDRGDRDKFSAAKDWNLENRAFTRSSSTFYGNGSFPGPLNTKRGIGRTVSDNGRYGSTGSRSAEPVANLRSPSENSKAERDYCSGPSPGYSGSPSNDKPNKAPDGHHFRDLHLSPNDSRSSSSPRFEPSSRFESLPRVFGNQSTSLEGSGSREHDRSKFYAWETSRRDRDFKERAWSRSEYGRRTSSLPKLDSPGDWSGGDRELLEGRIDRYGSASSREPAFPDVLNLGSKEHPRCDWRNKERSFSARTSTATTNSFLRDVGNCLEVPRVASPPKPTVPLSSVMHESSHDDTGLSSPKKRPRLTWGQGLAKYEREKTEEEPSGAKKFEESGHEEVQAAQQCVNTSLSHKDCSSQNSNISICLKNCSSCEGGFQMATQVDRAISGQESFTSSTTGSPPKEALCDKYAGIGAKVAGSSESQASTLVENVVSDFPPSVLHNVRMFLENYYRERPIVPKDVLTHHVEKVELEIELLEREIMKLDIDYGISPRKKEDKLVMNEENGSTCEVSNLNTSLVEHDSPEPLVVTPQQPAQCGDTTAVMDTCAEIMPVPNSRGQELLSEFAPREELLYGSCEVTDVAMVGTNVQDELIAMPENRGSGAHHDKLHGKGEYKKRMGFERDGGVVKAILLSNQKLAELSESSLAHLSCSRNKFIRQSGRLYGSPQEVDCWKLNMESHGKRRRLLESKVAEERTFARFSERLLTVKYNAFRESWKQKQTGKYSVTECEQGNDCSLESLHKVHNFTGSVLINAKNEELQETQNLKSDPCIENKRMFLRMPSMHLGQRERVLHRFETKNGLVEDPVTAEQERKAFNPWLPEERKIFLEKYSLFGKDFRRIATFLEHKTFADCIQFYYRNQKTEEFEKVHRRHQLEKCRDYRSSALYLATTTATSRYREGNAICTEGLALVAAAAAAMSPPRNSPKVSRGLVTKPCTKVFHEELMMKHASYPALPVRGNNEEKVGTKGARSSNGRSKTSNDETIEIQWSDNEKDLFIRALVMFGKNFYSIAQHVGSKSEGQCKSFFSKARKRLGLDQFLERHKAILEVPMIENQGTTEVTVTPAVNVGGRDLCNELFVSAPPVETHSELIVLKGVPEPPQEYCKRDDAGVISSLKCSQEAGHTGDVMADLSVCNSVVYPSDISVKREGSVVRDSVETTSSSEETGAAHALNAQMSGSLPASFVQGCSAEQRLVCGESLQLKTEPVTVKVEPSAAPSVLNGICNVTSPHIKAFSPPLVVSALVRNSPSAPSPVQSKDQSLKAMETKARREPTSWTQEEREKFVDVLKVHGKNWDRLRESLPGKSLTQIKTYFQNSKAKLGFGAEGVSNGNGRVSSSRKRKADDSDSSSNAGSGGLNTAPKASINSDDGSFKVSPSMPAPSAEALVYSNLFGRPSLEDPVNTQKVFHSIGLTHNAPAGGMHSLFNPTIFTSSNLRAAQQAYVHPNSVKTQQVVGIQQPHQPLSPLVVVQPPMVSGGIHHTHQQLSQQPLVRMLQDLTPTTVQNLLKQPNLHQTEALFQQQQQQVIQQVAESMLQQQLQPQLFQRQQNLMAQQVPHFQQALSQHQATATQQPSNSAAAQLPQAAGLGPPLVVAGQPIGNSLLQQQSELLQSQGYQIHAKTPPLLPSCPQTPQLQHLQLLQLHWQQQAAQVQQAQAKQIQTNQLFHLPQTNFTLPNEQQQLGVTRGMMQATSASSEVLKHSEIELANISNSHGGCDDVHPSTLFPQASHSPVSEAQLRAGDVKLFGQSLLSQPSSSNQQQSVKLPSSLSQQGAFPVPSTSSSLGFRGAESEQFSVQEAVTRMNERLIRDARGMEDARANAAAAFDSHVVRVPDNRVLSVVPIDSTRAEPNDLKSCENDLKSSENVARSSDDPMSFEKVTVANKCRVQEFGLSVTGGQTASQGLPRVLDALVALAEWRLQNANGGSGRITDEFLSQSWEALQRDPGALVEAGKAGGSLAQIYAGNGEMLQHLKESLPAWQPRPPLHHPGANGVGGWAASSGLLHVSDAQNSFTMPSSVQLNDGVWNPIRAEEIGLLEVRDRDGASGASG